MLIQINSDSNTSFMPSPEAWHFYYQKIVKHYYILNVKTKLITHDKIFLKIAQFLQPIKLMK
jgi:hypothetical protein